MCFKLLSLNFAITHAQKKVVLLIRICHTRVALKHNKTDLSLETRSEINFEFIKLVNCLLLTKQIGNIKCLVIFDLSRLSITFFCQISQTNQYIGSPFLD